MSQNRTQTSSESDLVLEKSREKFSHSEGVVPDIRRAWLEGAVRVAGEDDQLWGFIDAGDRGGAVGRCVELLEMGGWGDVNPNWVLGEILRGRREFRWR